MKKLFLVFTVALTLIMGAAPRSAAQTRSKAWGDPYSTEVATMLELTDARNLLLSTLTSAYKAMNLPVKNVGGLSKAIVDGIWVDYVSECVIPVYKKYYTLDELKQLNEFYRTPVGRKFGKTSVQMSQEVTKKMQDKLQTRITNIITDYMK